MGPIKLRRNKTHGGWTRPPRAIIHRPWWWHRSLVVAMQSCRISLDRTIACHIIWCQFQIIIIMIAKEGYNQMMLLTPIIQININLITCVLWRWQLAIVYKVGPTGGTILFSPPAHVFVRRGHTCGGWFGADMRSHAAVAHNIDFTVKIVKWTH